MFQLGRVEQLTMDSLSPISVMCATATSGLPSTGVRAGLVLIGLLGVVCCICSTVKASSKEVICCKQTSADVLSFIITLKVY